MSSLVGSSLVSLVVSCERVSCMDGRERMHETAVRDEDVMALGDAGALLVLFVLHGH